MNLPRNKALIENARYLRKNMTRQERHLWYDFLRYCKPRFRRQEIIGNYIADFFCHEAGLIIELDGSGHYDHENVQRDNLRTEYFHTLGIRVLRFSNQDVDRKFESVCQAISLAAETCGVATEAVFEKDVLDDPSAPCGGTSPEGEA